MEINKALQRVQHRMLGQAGIHTWIYDVKKKSIIRMDWEGRETEVLYENFPERQLKQNRVYPLDKKKVIGFFEDIAMGKPEGSIEIRWHQYEEQEYEWYRYSYTTIFDGNEPVKAVLLRENIQTEKSLWEQNNHLYGELMEDEENLEGVLLRHLAAKSFYIILFVDGNTGRAVEYLEHPKEYYRYFEPIENIDVNSEKYLRKYCKKEMLDSVLEKSRLSYVLEQLEKGPEYSFYFEGLNVKGESRFLKAECTFVNKAKKQICLAFTDVTDAVEQNKNQRQAVEIALRTAQSAMETRETFLANISHQIRTPLNAIVGMAELAKMEGFDVKRLPENMDIVLASSQTLVNMVDNLLDASQASLGNIVIKPTQCDIYQILDTVRREFRSLHLRSGQNYVENIQIKHEQVLCDRSRLIRVLLNVLGNAAKFTPIGGNIIFTVVEEETIEGKANFKFVVTDTGRGIEPEDLKHVFEPFYRDRDSQDNYLEGNGLGLAVAKQLLEAKGANITIDSTPGKGTTVEINDILGVVEVSQDLDGRELDTLLADRRILLAEDQPINLIVAKRMLERYGARVDAAENGKIALDMYLAEPEYTYDFMFMDIQMPFMNGYETARQIRNADRPDAKSIKIVSMTADVFPEDVQKALDAGMNTHIGKPIRAEALTMLVKELIQQ